MDEAIWNCDYCQTVRGINFHEMNKMERAFLRLLNYDVNITHQTYVEYYFTLREYAKFHGMMTTLGTSTADERQRRDCRAVRCSGGGVCEPVYRSHSHSIISMWQEQAL